MKNPDRLSSVFFIVLSIAACLAALQMSVGTFKRPGPMISPFLLSLSLLVLSIVLFAQSFSSSSSLSSFSNLFPKGEGFKVLYLLGVLSLTIIIFEPVGYITSTFILLVLLLKGIARKTILKSLFYSLIISLSSYLLFARVLKVRLPQGFIWFF